jgi:hypothetical protein
MVKMYLACASHSMIDGKLEHRETREARRQTGHFPVPIPIPALALSDVLLEARLEAVTLLARS